MWLVITIVCFTNVQKNSNFYQAVQNVNFSRNCLKFHIPTKIVVLKVYLEKDRPTVFYLINILAGTCKQFNFCLLEWQLWALKLSFKRGFCTFARKETEYTIYNKYLTQELANMFGVALVKKTSPRITMSLSALPSKFPHSPHMVFSYGLGAKTYTSLWPSK